MRSFLEKYETQFNTEIMQRNDAYRIITITNPSFKECKLLCTDGLNAINQNVIKGSEAYKNIELFFCLPDYWNLKENNWPITWLKKLGDYVAEGKSWLGNGHTLPCKDGKLAENFNAEAFILMKPVYLKNFFGDDFVAENGFAPLAIVPIFRQELDLKLKTSHTLVFEKLESKGYDERVDVYRKSAMRKRIFGII